MEKLPTQARRSITFDIGGEFAKHDDVVKKPGLETYFCDPYSSWKKGGVEHANGRLRRDSPRWINLKTMDKEDFDEVIENYNTTPIKKIKMGCPHSGVQQKYQPCCTLNLNVAFDNGY